MLDIGAAPARPVGPLSLRRYAVLVGTGALVTTFAQSRVLAQLPTTFLLKDVFHLEQQDVAIFFFWVTFPWNVKPLAGILTDGFPLFGSRRRHYLLLGTLAACASWAAMGLFSASYYPLLYATLAMNAATVVASTVVGGLMVEASHRFGASGRMTSLRLLVQYGSFILAPGLGGYLAARAYGWTAGIGAAAMLSLAVCAFLLLREERFTATAQTAVAVVGERLRVPTGLAVALVAMTVVATALMVLGLRNVAYSLYALLAVLLVVLVLTITRTANAVVAAGQVQLGQILNSRTLWLALAMLFLFYTVPGFNTALVYRQSDHFKFGTSLIGLLGSLEAAFGVAAAALYVLFCRKLSLRGLLATAIGLSAGASSCYLFYSAATAPFIHPFAGFAAVLVECTMMDLAIRSTPRGCEALGFALLMGVVNFSLATSDVIGTQLMDQYHLTFNTLIGINVMTTMAALLFVPFLPAPVVTHREGET